MAFFKEELVTVKAFIFDVDGVMSAATQVLTPEGETTRTSNLKDGFALIYTIKNIWIYC